MCMVWYHHEKMNHRIYNVILQQNAVNHLVLVISEDLKEALNFNETMVAWRYSRFNGGSAHA